MKNTICFKLMALFVLGFLILNAKAQAQEHADSVVVTEDVKANEVLNFAERMPEFPGGTDKMYDYLSENIIYPSNAKIKKIEGRVVLTFVVTNTGDITEVMVVSPPFGYGIEEEALRVVKAMPKWNPGILNGKPVFVKFTLPIRFALR